MVARANNLALTVQAQEYGIEGSSLLAEEGAAPSVSKKRTREKTAHLPRHRQEMSFFSLHGSGKGSRGRPFATASERSKEPFPASRKRKELLLPFSRQ